MAKVVVLCLLFASLAFSSPVEDFDYDESSPSSAENQMPNFYAVDTLADGEMERRFHLDGISLKETTAIYEMNGIKEGAILRQMTDGHHLIQLIYDASESLTDCEYVSDAETVQRFQQTLADEYVRLSTISFNNTIRYVESGAELPHELANLSDYARLKKRCRSLHKKMRKDARAAALEGKTSSRRKRDIMMMPGTKWCGAGHRAKGYKDLGAEQAVDYCCRRHDHCPETIRSKITRFGVTNNRPITVSLCDCDERQRRSADDLFMIPHTKWCGKGNRASGPSQLGGFAAADRCCRQHDRQCPHFIPAWAEKYDLFNSRPYTAMHCTCDDRFRSCLKQANTAAANLVGKLFFNVIQTKCFVLKPEKVCKHSSWWGKCTKFTWEKKAIFRDPIPF